MNFPVNKIKFLESNLFVKLKISLFNKIIYKKQYHQCIEAITLIGNNTIVIYQSFL